MKTYSIADKSKYYRQNNNAIKPTIRCKPTATVECLDLAGWPLPKGDYKQPEDNLTEFIERKYGADAPEDWQYIQKALNEDLYPEGKPVESLRYDWSIQEALFSIVERKPFVMSSSLTKAGHIVGIVEWTTMQDEVPKTPSDIRLDMVKDIFIDDPYGLMENGKYNTNKSGFKTRYDLAGFKRIWRGIGIKIRRNQ